MNTKNILKVKRPIKPQTPPPLNDSAIEEAVEALQKLKLSQEQTEPMVVTDAFLETPRDASVYGCGWRLTELLNEFSGRYDG